MKDIYFYVLSIHIGLNFLSKKSYVNFQDQSIKSVISFLIRIYSQLKTWSITRQGIRQALINLRMKHLPRQAVYGYCRTLNSANSQWVLDVDQASNTEPSQHLRFITGLI